MFYIYKVPYAVNSFYDGDIRRDLSIESNVDFSLDQDDKVSLGKMEALDKGIIAA